MDLEKDSLMWEEIKCNHIVQNEWIDFRESSYRFPDGSEASPYYSYSRRDYVVIVASDEDGKYICVNQFRQGIKDVTAEFPAGASLHAQEQEVASFEWIAIRGHEDVDALDLGFPSARRTLHVWIDERLKQKY